MKIRLLLFILLLLVNKSFSQQLSKSRETGYFTYIYKLTEKEMTLLSQNSKMDERFLHTVVDSFEMSKRYSKDLPTGYYVYLSAVGNTLSYSFHGQQNVAIEFVNNENDFQLTVRDLKGELISNAQVYIGKAKRVKYDPITHLYHGSYQKEDIVHVVYQGVTNFFEFEVNDRYNAREDWSFFKKISYSFPIKYFWTPFKNKMKDNQKPAYAGYLVFDKPKYKPLDSVRLKAYIVKSDGSQIRDRLLDVLLYKNDESPKKLASIRPYKDGAYTFNFKLLDSLNLKLDYTYTISLVDQGVKKEKLISRNFKYEDYELKALTFNLRTDKKDHQIGSPITVYMKAVDENELPVADGRVELIATTTRVAAYYDRKVFVPDTLWKKEITLDPVGETKLVLPDSIFPKVNLSFNLEANFRNSNNESREQNENLNYTFHKDIEAKEIISVLEKDSLVITYKENGKAKAQKAKIKVVSFNYDEIDSVFTTLPVKLKANYNANYYEVHVENGYQQDIDIPDFNPKLDATMYQSKDSLRIKVENENLVPFWYTVFSGKRVFHRGYVTKLDTIFKHTSNRAAQIVVNYFWDEKEKKVERTSVYNPHVLNVKLIAPPSVYPGQSVNMLVQVTDVENRPVPETDLTAYAWTSKFGNTSFGGLPNFNRSFQLRKRKANLSADELTLNGTLKLNWDRWAKTLGLDTIEYYKFTNPKELYISREKLSDTTSQVAPFVMTDGKIEPVNIIYIDNIPVYFSQATHLQRYSFPIDSGKHKLTLRTASKLITLDDFNFPLGYKTILGISSSTTNKLAKIVAAKQELSAEEADELTNYMVTLTDNFDGKKTIVTADSAQFLLNPPPKVIGNKDVLVGPIKGNLLSFQTEGLSQNFVKEANYTYTFLPGLLKQKSNAQPYPFNLKLNTKPEGENNNYKQFAIKKGEIDSLWNEYLNLRSASTRLFITRSAYENSGFLTIAIDTAFKNKLPYLKNVIIYKPAQPDFVDIYNGNTTDFRLEEGQYQVLFLLKDNRYFSTETITVKANGKNYLKWESFKVAPADVFSKRLDSAIKSARSGQLSPASDELLQLFSGKNFVKSLLVKTISGRVVDQQKKPLSGIYVSVLGLANQVSTDSRGLFSLKTPLKGKIIFNSVGFERKEIEINTNNVGDVLLEENKGKLDEVVVIGYGSVSRKQMAYSTVVVTESASINSSLMGRMPGLSLLQVTAGEGPRLMIRGNNSLVNDKNALIVVDGIVVSQDDFSKLNPGDIAGLEILRSAAATALYGARAANGVIIISTKKGEESPLPEPPPAAGLSLRNNFSDSGFWQPRLTTNSDGVATFTAKFPDDITNWNTTVLAMNGRKQVGFTQTSIKSFKTVSANFVSPLFAVSGDSINVIGKLMNYSPTTQTVTRKFSFNGIEMRNSSVVFKNAHIDTISVVAKSKDSLSFEYTLKRGDDYFDGELRKIPVFEAGVKETKGYFSALLRDTAVNYNFDTKLGKVSINIESSVFPILLDEITKLRDYEYLCNEQLASKLKALLLEKKVRAFLKESFTHEKDVNLILRKLQQYKKPQGTWGWWQNSNEEIWISLHVVEALLQAEKQGYKVELDKKVLFNYLTSKLSGSSEDTKLSTIKLLRLLDDKYYFKDWLSKRLTKSSLYDQLQLIRLKQMAGIKVNIDSVLKIKKQTMFGNSYWGESSFNFWDNSIQNTLTAYQILKANGGYHKELEKIQLYFLEQRKNGQWRNTFESALILETILPDMLENGKNGAQASVKLEGNLINQFPYHTTVENTSALEVEKTGAMPVYFTAFQQFQNPAPEKSSKDFTVNGKFLQNGLTVAKLKAGLLTTLRVEVEVRADADYVMIEIPIPAGCSYENKVQNFWGVETHREYFKNKTSIFCTKLKQGKYTFNIDLMPRYGGSYVLNPAKAEMMYFPVFFGREGMKRVTIN